MTLPVSFTIKGAPRTKKNNPRMVMAGTLSRLIPSKSFKQWNKDAQVYLMLLRSSLTGPISQPVNCRALFYLDRYGTGDACNYYQALADALQQARIIKDDRLIEQWDGSRLIQNAPDPRIEFTLSSI